MCKRGHLGRFGYFLLCSLCKKALFLFLSFIFPFLRGFLHFLDIEAKSLSCSLRRCFFYCPSFKFLILPLPIPAATTMFLPTYRFSLIQSGSSALSGVMVAVKPPFCACYRGNILIKGKSRQAKLILSISPIKWKTPLCAVNRLPMPYLRRCQPGRLKKSSLCLA